MFEIRHLDPESYRRQTRRIGLLVVLMFAVIAMTLASASVGVFGEPGGNNFRWNLGGVLAGLALTVVVVRLLFWQRPWMAPAVYGWQLKRNLMRITNIMHHVEAGVAVGDPHALKLLRFYHLGLEEMQRLDGNPGGDSDLTLQRDALERRLLEQGIAPDQYRLDPGWLESVRRTHAR